MTFHKYFTTATAFAAVVAVVCLNLSSAAPSPVFLQEGACVFNRKNVLSVVSTDITNKGGWNMYRQAKRDVLKLSAKAFLRWNGFEIKKFETPEFRIEKHNSTDPPFPLCEPDYFPACTGAIRAAPSRYLDANCSCETIGDDYLMLNLTFTLHQDYSRGAVYVLWEGDALRGIPSISTEKLMIPALGIPDPTGPAAPMLYHAERDVYKRRGITVFLECIGVGQPRPTLEWKRKGETLSFDWKYKPIPSIDGPNRSILRLRISDLVRRDYGQYECSGYNTLGNKTIVFNLIRADI